MVNEQKHGPDGEQMHVQCIDGGQDLVCLRRNVRGFLSEIDKLVVSEAILVAVILVADAFRYGAPPVFLALQFAAGRRHLRIEVADHRPFSSGSRPHGYRAGLLDRLASRRGLEPSGNGGTKTWVEMAVTPRASRNMRTGNCDWDSAGV